MPISGGIGITGTMRPKRGILVDSDTDTVSLGALDLDADGKYIIHFAVHCPLSGTTSAGIDLQYNGDTTAAHYSNQHIFGNNTSVYGDRQANAGIVAVYPQSTTSGVIEIDRRFVGRQIKAHSRVSRYLGADGLSIQVKAHVWKGPDGLGGVNVTSGQLIAATAGVIGAGSYFDIWCVPRIVGA